MNRINQLAIWLKMAGGTELLVKKFPEGYPYKGKSDIMLQSTMLKPVYRYAKNYEVGGQVISLCMITLDDNMTALEKWMDNRAAKLTEADIAGKFVLLDVFYE